MLKIEKKIKKDYPKIFKVLKKIFYFFEEIKVHIRLFISIIMRIFPINRKKIVFVSYFGNSFGDNGYYITKEIIIRNLDINIVWLIKGDIKEKIKFPENVRVVNYGSLKALYELATSLVWVDNSRKKIYPQKRKKQKYIQTWHGGIPLKKIEADATKSLDSYYIKTAKNDSQMADLFISNSSFISDLYRKSFWYDKKILESGYPRSDLFFSDLSNVKAKVKDYFNIEPNSKILLYAPTFRKDGSLSAYNISFDTLIAQLNKKNEKWIVLLRLHPNLMNKNIEFEFSDNIINATKYPDMQELIVTCDVLITDYSSCMFDGALMKKPTFLYASDIEDYKADRGTYFEFDELPFMLAETNQQLLNNLENFNQKTYEEKVDSFNKRVGLIEHGNASEKIVDYICEVMNLSDRSI